jgi:hypothetical protein
VCNIGGRDHLGVWFDRLRLQDRQDDMLDAGKKSRERMPRGCRVEGQLRVQDVLVAIRIEREDAHAGAEFVVDNLDCAANADEQIERAEGTGDGGKVDTILGVVLGVGRIEKPVQNVVPATSVKECPLRSWVIAA